MLSITGCIRASSNALINSTKSFLNAPIYNIRMGERLAGHKTKTLEEKLGFAERPKKPLTPYFRFMKETRPILLAKNPNLSSSEIVKVMAKQWETVDEKQKQKYQEEFKKEQVVYLENRVKYENSLTPEQKQDIEDLKQKIDENKERLLQKKRVRELGRPKRAASAFLLYLKDLKEKTPIGASESYKDWQIKCSQKWKELPAEQKEKYLALSKKNILNYQEELLKWEKKMIQEGNNDLVRVGMLIEPSLKKSVDTKISRRKE